MLVNKLLLGAVVLIVIVGFLIVTDSMAPGEYDGFAQCLTEKGVKMYGAFWCSHCENNKKEFGNSWKYVDYVECDARGANAQPELCREKGVLGYPTWEINGKMYQGEQSLEALSAASGCPLIKDKK